MKHLIVFILCLFCASFETSAIYSVDNQSITGINPVSSSLNAPVFKPKKLSYKQRVVLKYLKYKEKASTNKAARGFLVAGVIFLIVGVVALVSSQNQPSDLNGLSNGCLGAFLGIGALIVSAVMFIAAAVAAI
jgi:hypothetical protein